jgi:predicted nicotinamide N-methyase
MELTLAPVPLVPEIHVHQAPAAVGLWELAGGDYRSDEPPPFWAFAWAGGQALARYLLDNPGIVAGRRVVDVGAGSGLVAIAAARAGAAEVHAVDADAGALRAVERNAAANGVSVRVDGAGDIAVDRAGVVLAGDVFYTATAATGILALLRRAAGDGARVLVGDPDRGYLPRRMFRALAGYDVPVPPVLEDVPVRHATVWELAR